MTSTHVAAKSSLASHAVRPDDMQRKSWLARSRAWVSIALLTPVGALVLFSRLHFGLESTGETVCTLLGAALFITGFAWRWWATLYIGGLKDKRLIKQGPYSMCRNPLYFGTFLLTLSTAVFMQSATLAVVMLLVSIYYLGVTIPNEEHRLEMWLGREYRDYKAKVPRFWPQFSRYRSEETVAVSLVGIRAEAKRSLRYILIPLICHAVLHLRAHDWWPNTFWLP